MDKFLRGIAGGSLIDPSVDELESAHFTFKNGVSISLDDDSAKAWWAQYNVLMGILDRIVAAQHQRQAPAGPPPVDVDEFRRQMDRIPKAKPDNKKDE